MLNTLRQLSRNLRTGRFIPYRLDIAKIKKLYLEEYKSSLTIGRLVGASSQCVVNTLRQNGVQLRPVGGNISRRIYSDKERLERNCRGQKNWYKQNIKPVTTQKIKKRLLKKICLMLSRAKECEVCKKTYLPTRYYYYPCYQKSRFCSRKCQHVSQAIEFKDGRFAGENNPAWEGGISGEPYNWRFRKLRTLIRNRDNHKCQLCGVPEVECLRGLDVHHIDYDKKNCNIKNLISLCASCHTKTNFNREHWKSFFSKKRRTDSVKLV